MKALIIGATGFVGSGVARAFLARGYDVHGLSRSDASAATLRQAGVTPVAGSFADLDTLCAVVRNYEIIVLSVMIPMSEEPAVLQALINACQDKPTHFLFTSGTSVIGIEAKDGLWNENSFAEQDIFPFPQRIPERMEAEALVCNSANGMLHTTVVRPPLIYGRAAGGQLPYIFQSARATGKVCFLGAGRNLYSNVHIDDLSEIYCLAVERGTPGALYHAVSGEADFRSIAEAIASVVGCDAKSVTYAEAVDIWGQFYTDIALAVNSRSRAPRTRADLGWNPKHTDVIGEIREGTYRDEYVASRGTRPSAHLLSSHGSLAD